MTPRVRRTVGWSVVWLLGRSVCRKKGGKLQFNSPIGALVDLVVADYYAVVFVKIGWLVEGWRPGAADPDGVPQQYS